MRLASGSRRGVAGTSAVPRAANVSSTTSPTGDSSALSRRRRGGVAEASRGIAEASQRLPGDVAVRPPHRTLGAWSMIH